MDSHLNMNSHCKEKINHYNYYYSIFIEDEEEFNVVDILEENLDKSANFQKNNIYFKDMQIYQVRGQKYFVIIDN